MKKLLAILVCLLPVSAMAQTAAQSDVGFLLAQGSTYGSYTCPAAAVMPCFVQYGSAIPVTGSFTPSGTQDVNITQTGGVTQLRGTGATGTGSERVTVAVDSATVAGSASLPTGTNSIGTVGPSSRTLVTLAIKTVTTGGTAVNAISAGGRTFGGFIQNPPSATVNLCINEIGTATGTTSSGDTTCIQPGAAYKVAPASTAVSVISSDSAHPFSGYGLN